MSAHDRRRKWPRFARDCWLVLVSGLVALSLANTRSTIGRLEKVGTAVCSLREDLRGRVRAGDAFLATHPHGIPGIPRATLQVTVANERHTLQALHPLAC